MEIDNFFYLITYIGENPIFQQKTNKCRANVFLFSASCQSEMYHFHLVLLEVLK